jgi:hypothetical protein
VASRPGRRRRRAATTFGRGAIAFGGILALAAVTAVTAGVALGSRERESRSPARLAWFFRPPDDGTRVRSIASRHTALILTGRFDIPYRRRLRNAGWRGDAWLYVAHPFTAAPLGGPCGAFARRWDLWDNQVAWNHRPGVRGSNDFCRIVHPNERWLLHQPNGERVTRRAGNQIQYYMNPGNRQWREFFARRVRLALRRWRYDAVFLDDVWNDAAAHGDFREYRTDAAYERAVLGFLQHLRRRVPGVRIIANVERPAVYSPLLDGWFYEAFAGYWRNEHQRASEIVELWGLAERDAAAGKDVVLVAQGQRDDQARVGFAYAAYLMVAHPRVSFRYSNVYSYREFWDSPLFRLRLGAPTGRRRAVGERVWRRDFAAGTAVVNLSDDAAQIDLGRDYVTQAGERVRVLALPAKAGVVLRLPAR